MIVYYGNSGTQFFLYALLSETLSACMFCHVKKRATRDTLFRYHEPYRVPETSVICKTCQFIFLQGNIYFQFVPFRVLFHNRWNLCAIVIVVIALQDILYPSKGCLVDDSNVHKNFSALNVAIVLSSFLLAIVQSFQYLF